MEGFCYECQQCKTCCCCHEDDPPRISDKQLTKMIEDQERTFNEWYDKLTPEEQDEYVNSVIRSAGV
jgi:hypothetical protein